MTSDVFCFLKKFVLFALTSFFTGALAFASDTKSPVFAYSVPVDASILGGGLALTARGRVGGAGEPAGAGPPDQVHHVRPLGGRAVYPQRQFCAGGAGPDAGCGHLLPLRDRQ